MKRVVFDTLLLLSVFILPWYISGIIAFIGILAFKQFYEFIIMWITMYSMFAIPEVNLLSNSTWFTLIVSIVYIAIQYLRLNMIIYKNEI